MSKNERIKLENAIYEVVLRYLTPHETRGLNSHARAQMIAYRVGEEFTIWINQNTLNGCRNED